MIHLFGDTLKKLRKEQNLTQEEFGKIFGVASNTVSYWESNTSKPDIDLVIQIAKHFNVSVDYLLGIDQEDTEKIDKLKIAMKEVGMMASDDLTIEELEKALQIVEMMKDRK